MKKEKRINNIHINTIPEERNNLKINDKNILNNILVNLINIYCDINNLGDELQITLKPKVKYDVITTIINLLNLNDIYLDKLKKLSVEQELLL